MEDRREYSLDVLKFIATIIIIFHHYQQLTRVFFEGKINFYGGNFYWGYMVELFFILSGYFTHKYVEQIDEKSYFLPFIKKKYGRFLPMLIFSGGVSFFVDYIYYEKIMMERLPYTIWGVVTSLLGTSRWLDDRFMVNNPMWYISVLLFCYIVFFGTTYVAKRLKINPYILYCILIYWGIECKKGAMSLAIFSNAMGRGYSCFFFGIVLQYLFKKYHAVDKIKNLFFSIVGLWGFVCIYKSFPVYIGEDLENVLIFLVFPLVILIFKSKYVSGFFKNDILKNLAGISFNAYLWHLTVIRVLLVISKIFKIEVNRYLTMLLVTFGIFVIGIMSHSILEKEIVNEMILKRCKK